MRPSERFQISGQLSQHGTHPLSLNWTRVQWDGLLVADDTKLKLANLIDECPCDGACTISIAGCGPDDLYLDAR